MINKKSGEIIASIEEARQLLSMSDYRLKTRLHVYGKDAQIRQQHDGREDSSRPDVWCWPCPLEIAKALIEAREVEGIEEWRIVQSKSEFKLRGEQ